MFYQRYPSWLSVAVMNTVTNRNMGWVEALFQLKFPGQFKETTYDLKAGALSRRSEGTLLASLLLLVCSGRKKGEREEGRKGKDSWRSTVIVNSWRRIGSTEHYQQYHELGMRYGRCISYFSCWDQLPITNSREKNFTLSHGLKVFGSSKKETHGSVRNSSCGGSSMKALVTLCPQSSSNENRRWCSDLFSFHSLRHPSP